MRLERNLLSLIKVTNSKQPRKRLTRVRDGEAALYLLIDAMKYEFITGLFAKRHLMF